VVEPPILPAARHHAAPQHECLQVLKDQHADESEAKDDENEHDVENHEHDRKVAFEDAVRHEVVAGKSDEDQDQGYHQLVDRDAHVLQSLDFDTDFVFAAPIEV